MARRPTLRRQLDDFLKEYDPRIKREFLDSIDDIKSRAVLDDIIDKLKARDVSGAIAILGVERAAFANVEAAIAQAYAAGGSAMVNNLPTLRDGGGARVVVRFDVRALRAEAWIREQSSQLITGPYGEVEKIRANARVLLERGLAAGKGPDSLARDLVGRTTGFGTKRVGGIIGLNGPQIDELEKVQAMLADPDQIRRYFVRDQKTGKLKHRYSATPKNFDEKIAQAIKDGKALPAELIGKHTTLHSNELLFVRGRVIGRTEAISALQAGKHEGFVQGLEKTNYSPGRVEKVWRSAGDGRVRHTHSGLNGRKVTGLETPFVSPSGARMRFPGDTSLGAPASETIQCRCDVDYRIDFSEGVE